LPLPLRASLRRIIPAACLFVAIAALLAWLNVLWLIPLTVAALVLGVVTRRHRMEPWGKALFFVALIAIAVVLYFFGVLPTPLEPDTSTGVRLPWVGHVARAGEVEGAGSKRQADPVKATLDQFDNDVFNPDVDSIIFLRLAAASWFNNAERFARSMQEKRPDLTGLRDLEDALNQLRPLVQGLDERKLENFLQGLTSYRARLYKSGTVADANAVMREFDTWYLKNSLGDIQLMRGRLNNVLDKVVTDAARQTVKVSSGYVAALDEAGGRWLLHEQIRLRAPMGSLRAVDVEPLVKMVHPGAPEPEIRLSYLESCETDGDAIAARAFRVEPAAVVCLDLRTAMSAFTTTLNNPLRVASFKGTKLAWPPSSPGRMSVTVDLSTEGIPLQRPVTIDIARTEPLTSIRLPRHSFFSASLPVTLDEAATNVDVIRPTMPIGIQEFAGIGYHWIELLPDSRLVRREWVQSNRKYLFPENVVMLLVVAAIGAFFGVVFPDSK
jgi:hypothetical protein